MYESMTDYARSLDRFRQKVGVALDLNQENHRLALLNFLNDWGCRNLAREWHWLASEELERWNGSVQDRLQILDHPGTELDETRQNDLADIFDSLSTRIVSKPTKNSKQVRVSFGPHGHVQGPLCPEPPCPPCVGRGDPQAFEPLLKWAALAVVVVPLCFGLSALLRKLPYADRVL